MQVVKIVKIFFKQFFKQFFKWSFNDFCVNAWINYCRSGSRCRERRKRKRRSRRIDRIWYILWCIWCSQWENRKIAIRMWFRRSMLKENKMSNRQSTSICASFMNEHTFYLRLALLTHRVLLKSFIFLRKWGVKSPIHVDMRLFHEWACFLFEASSWRIEFRWGLPYSLVFHSHIG